MRALYHYDHIADLVTVFHGSILLIETKWVRLKADTLNKKVQSGSILNGDVSISFKSIVSSVSLKEEVQFPLLVTRDALFYHDTI